MKLLNPCFLLNCLVILSFILASQAGFARDLSQKAVHDCYRGLRELGNLDTPWIQRKNRQGLVLIPQKVRKRLFLFHEKKTFVLPWGVAYEKSSSYSYFALETQIEGSPIYLQLSIPNDESNPTLIQGSETRPGKNESESKLTFKKVTASPLPFRGVSALSVSQLKRMKSEAEERVRDRMDRFELDEKHFNDDLGGAESPEIKKKLKNDLSDLLEKRERFIRLRSLTDRACKQVLKE